jgi:hypothetical protein
VYMRHQNGISRQILFTSMITFTCTQCGQEVTQPQYPHPVSRYLCFHCEEAAKKESRRESTQQRVKRYRERKRQAIAKPIPAECEEYSS